MKRKIPTMETPVINYWGFKEHPFADYILEGDSLGLFVNRDTEIHRLHNCLTNRLTGVTGTPGVGKSSYFFKFKYMIDAKYPVVYVQMAGKSEKTLYREILKALLISIGEGKIKTKSIGIKIEMERVQHSFQLSREAEFGASSILTGKIKETKSQKIDAHTEETATILIQDIIYYTKTAFIVIIDDMERIKFMFENESLYFRFIVSFSRTVNEAFNHPGVSILISLDDNFAKRVQNFDNPTINDDNTLSFGAIVELKTFKPNHLLELLKARLIRQNWKGNISKFITRDAFWVLQSISGGHARKALSTLRAAMEYVEFKKLPCQITTDVIIFGLREMRGKEIDPKSIQIIRYLEEHGPSSPSDPKFLESSELSRSALLNHLKGLSGKLHMDKDTIDPISKKQNYSLPSLKNWQ